MKRVQSSLLVQVWEINDSHTAVAKRDDVTIAPLHGGEQVVKMILDLVRAIIHNFTLVNLNDRKHSSGRQHFSQHGNGRITFSRKY